MSFGDPVRPAAPVGFQHCGAVRFVAGSRLTIRSASSASRQRPEVTSGQARPVSRRGPVHWRTTFPAERSAAIC